MKKALPFIAGFVLSGTSVASEYQFMVYGTYSKSDYEYDSGFEVDGNESAVSSLISFQPVDVDKGPYAEAIFLNKSSYIQISADKSNYKAEYQHYSSTLKNKGYEFAINQVFDDKLAIYADYSKDESDSEESYGFGLGVFLSDTLFVEWTYDIDEDDDYSDNQTTGLSLYSVNELSGDRALRSYLSVSYTKFENSQGKDSVTSLYGSFNYYFNQSFSLGSSFFYNQDDDITDAYLGISSEYFVRPDISIGLNYLDYGLSDELEGEFYSVFTRIRF